MDVTRKAAVLPTGQERVLGEHDMIVTKTDLRGVITYANDYFLQVSALTRLEAIGKPHSLVRHPDMPRCIFKLLWDTIGGGDELFAYIVNLARDGAHYWVLAHVTPSVGAGGTRVGYHSNRRRPSRAAVAAMTGLYAGLSAEERRHTRPQAAIEASTRLLEHELAEQGRTYDEFIWSIADAGVPAVTA